jgi:Fe-S cluster biogenesis protein NfuA
MNMALVLDKFTSNQISLSDTVNIQSNNMPMCRVDVHWAPMLVGIPGNCPACPCVKMALRLGILSDISKDLAKLSAG